MRITLCVDALEPNPGGIGRYTWQLCQGLARREDLELRYFARRQFIGDPATLLRGEQPPRRKFRGLHSWWDRRKLRQGLFHGTNYFLPPLAEGVITVHDLSVFKYPETHPAERVRAFGQQFHGSLNRARHIITDTETVRAELISDFNIAPEMITAVHLGVESRFRQQSAASIGSALTQFGLQPKQYGLCVSALEPRKKIGELVVAWRRLRPDIRNRYPLVLAGGSGWLNEDLRAKIELGVAEGWLRHLGFVDEEVLPALYAGAALFVYPSIYEGFGLPPLEAMACGVPVVVSPRSCLPEVCGDAGRYVDPDHPDLLLTCLEESLTDEAWQAEAAKRGLGRASNFSWKRCVEQTADVYFNASGPT